MGETQVVRKIGKALSKIKTGTYVGINKGSSLVACFGCNSCSWRDTTMCPHGLVCPDVHENRICSERALYIRDVWEIAGSNTRWLQIEEATRLKLMLDKLTQEYTQGKEIDSNFTKISKNIISLLDKMRRQDEGLKVQQDININLDDFKKTVEAQAKVIIVETEGDITKTEDKNSEEDSDIRSDASGE